MTLGMRTYRGCRFSNPVSYAELLTSGNATCLSSCHPGSVSVSCHFSASIAGDSLVLRDGYVHLVD
jgi:hypothetical protein